MFISFECNAVCMYESSVFTRERKVFAIKYTLNYFEIQRIRMGNFWRIAFVVCAQQQQYTVYVIRHWMRETSEWVRNE